MAKIKNSMIKRLFMGSVGIIDDFWQDRVICEMKIKSKLIEIELPWSLFPNGIYDGIHNEIKIQFLSDKNIEGYKIEITKSVMSSATVMEPTPNVFLLEENENKSGHRLVEMSSQVEPIVVIEPSIQDKIDDFIDNNSVDISNEKNPTAVVKPTQE